MATYSILPISPTESEAPYVLDGLFDHDTILEIEKLFTDTGGALERFRPLRIPGRMLRAACSYYVRP